MRGTLRQVMHTGPVSIDLFLTLGGLFAGTVVGLTGLGGAAIVTPMLLLIFHVPPAVAVSTAATSAAWSASREAYGRWKKARSATQGECS